MSRRESNDAPGRHAWARVAAVCAAVALFVVIGHVGSAYVPDFAAWVDAAGPWGPAAFIAGYALATVAFVPGSVLTLAAGATFGLLQGTAYVMVGATLGACAAFLVSRHLAGAFVAQHVRGRRFAAVDRAVARDGRTIVFLLRLSPVFPFNVLNYALGVTQVRFLDYLIGCAGMLPGTLLYVYYGTVAGDVVRAASGATPDRGIAGYALLATGLAATVAATAIVTRAARNALRDRVGET